MGLSHCWRQDEACWCHWAPHIAQIQGYIGRASTAQAWTSTVGFRHSCLLSFLPLSYGPVTSWAPAAALVGIQRAHLEAAGCPNPQHNSALHIMLLPTVLCPLRVWKNPLFQQPLVTAQDWAGCAEGTRGLGLQLWIALLPHSLPCCLCCR